jgi:hypothetical protein
MPLRTRPRCGGRGGRRCSPPVALVGVSLPRSQGISPRVTLRLPDEARNVGGGRYTTLLRPSPRPMQAPIPTIREGAAKRRPARESAAAAQENL